MAEGRTVDMENNPSHSNFIVGKLRLDQDGKDVETENGAR